jgi:hypothetical protein
MIWLIGALGFVVGVDVGAAGVLVWLSRPPDSETWY